MTVLRWRKAATTLAMIGVFAHHEPSTAHVIASSRGRLSLPGTLAPGGARARTPHAIRRRAHRGSTLALSAARSDEDGYSGADETSSDLDMEVLRRRMRRNRASTLSADDDEHVVGSIYSPEDLASWEAEAEDLHADLESGWVLLFNAGTIDEGVYTVQDDDTTTFVLAFEDIEDATRFAQQLEAEEFDLPTVSNWDMDVLTEFCEADDFRIGWVPQGVRARLDAHLCPSPPRARALRGGGAHARVASRTPAFRPQVMLLPPRHNYYRDDLDQFDAEIVDDENGAPQQAGGRSQMASRVTPELISRLEHLLLEPDCDHPFDEPERQ